MPELGLGSAVSAIGVHDASAVVGPGLEDAAATACVRGPGACRPDEQGCWAGSHRWRFHRPQPAGTAAVHVRPASVVRSKCTRHTLGRSSRLGAAGGNQSSISKLNGLVFDRTQDAVRQASGVGPGPPAVARSSNHPPPALWTWRRPCRRASASVSGCSNSTGFQQAYRPPSACIPVATSIGRVHSPVTRRDSQMPTSVAPSRVPPNHAVTSPSRVSTMVDGGALANGADSNTNSVSVTPLADVDTCVCFSRVAVCRCRDSSVTDTAGPQDPARPSALLLGAYPFPILIRLTDSSRGRA